MSSLPSPIARQVLAVVTEAVSNAAKHSGGTHVTVAITVAEAGVRLVVADDGQGFDSPERISGLANIRRRAASLGGTSSVESSPGHGTKVIWSTIPE
jgi:signal transduction histidine kinase